MGSFAGTDDARVHQQLQPVGGFFQFFKTIAELGNELSCRTRAVGFAEIGADGGAGAEGLAAQDLCNGSVRQLFVDSDDPQCVLLGAQWQLCSLILHRASLIFASVCLNGDTGSWLGAIRKTVFLNMEADLGFGWRWRWFEQWAEFLINIPQRGVVQQQGLINFGQSL